MQNRKFQIILCSLYKYCLNMIIYWHYRSTFLLIRYTKCSKLLTDKCFLFNNTVSTCSLQKLWLTILLVSSTCTYVCVCVHVCMCACVCACVYVCTWVSISVSWGIVDKPLCENSSKMYCAINDNVMCVCVYYQVIFLMGVSNQYMLV